MLKVGVWKSGLNGIDELREKTAILPADWPQAKG
jgi:hypothetical protein